MVQVTPTTQLEIVSALSNCPIDVLKQLEQLQFAQIWAELVNGPLDLAQTKQFHKHIELHGKLYGFLDIKQLTIGEVADMDVLSKDPRKDQELHKMMAILYRPAINITDDWVVTEEYKAEGVAERAELFLDMPVEYVYSALAFFFAHQKVLYRNYAGLFDGDGGDDDGRKRDGSTDEADHIRAARNWYHTFVQLAGGDALKIGKVTKLGAIDAFNFLAYSKDKAKKEKLEHDRLMAQINAKR
jgi:hypothetical protein